MNCNNLTTITVADDNPKYISMDGQVYDRNTLSPVDVRGVKQAQINEEQWQRLEELERQQRERRQQILQEAFTTISEGLAQANENCRAVPAKPGRRRGR